MSPRLSLLLRLVSQYTRPDLDRLFPGSMALSLLSLAMFEVPTCWLTACKTIGCLACFPFLGMS